MGAAGLRTMLGATWALVRAAAYVHVLMRKNASRECTFCVWVIP